MYHTAKLGCSSKISVDCSYKLFAELIRDDGVYLEEYYPSAPVSFSDDYILPFTFNKYISYRPLQYNKMSCFWSPPWSKGSSTIWCVLLKCWTLILEIAHNQITSWILVVSGARLCSMRYYLMLKV